MEDQNVQTQAHGARGHRANAVVRWWFHWNCKWAGALAQLQHNWNTRRKRLQL